MCRSSTTTVGRAVAWSTIDIGSGGSGAGPGLAFGFGGASAGAGEAVEVRTAAPFCSVTPVQSLGSPEEDETRRAQHDAPDDPQLPGLRGGVHALELTVA